MQRLCFSIICNCPSLAAQSLLQGRSSFNKIWPYTARKFSQNWGLALFQEWMLFCETMHGLQFWRPAVLLYMYVLILFPNICRLLNSVAVGMHRHSSMVKCRSTSNSTHPPHPLPPLWQGVPLMSSHLWNNCTWKRFSSWFECKA